MSARVTGRNFSRPGRHGRALPAVLAPALALASALERALTRLPAAPALVFVLVLAFLGAGLFARVAFLEDGALRGRPVPSARDGLQDGFLVCFGMELAFLAG